MLDKIGKQHALMRYSLHFSLLLIVVFLTTACLSEQGTVKHDRPPNVIIILADDMGYGDIGIYGSENNLTPNLDRLGMEGQKWTNFYAASSVCTPSRAGLLTGIEPSKIGMASDGEAYRVLFPDSKNGLPQNVKTIARVLKDENYQTAIIGKWHLGHKPENMPTSHGFDYFYGIPYSNNMNSKDWSVELLLDPQSSENFDVPLMENEQEIERPLDQTTITRRYTEKAVEFINANVDTPFFLYLSHNMPHTPLFRGDEFAGRSKGGIYGDVIEELDWSVGQIMTALEQNEIAENTLVIFTSDNGPWFLMQHHGGSAGRLRDGKGTTWEGGIRVPAIFWWPSQIKPTPMSTTGSFFDILPTIIELTGAKSTTDGLDGISLKPFLMNVADKRTEPLYFYREGQIYAIRLGDYKAHFITETEYLEDNGYTEHFEKPLLYNVMTDPGELYDVGNQHPEIVEEMKFLREKQIKTVKLPRSLLLDLE